MHATVTYTHFELFKLFFWISEWTETRRRMHNNDSARIKQQHYITCNKRNRQGDNVWRNEREEVEFGEIVDGALALWMMIHFLSPWKMAKLGRISLELKFDQFVKLVQFFCFIGGLFSRLKANLHDLFASTTFTDIVNTDRASYTVVDCRRPSFSGRCCPRPCLERTTIIRLHLLL